MATMERQLLEVIDILDAEGIVYHLEGGTLLGIVREQRILPWDHDTDISILRSSLPDAMGALAKIKKKGWRLTFRTYDEPNGYAEVGDTCLVRVKDRKLYFIAGDHMLDFFVKTEKDGYVYWKAAGNIMRVKASYYDGYETVEWRGRDIKVPVNYRDYLTEKYGDWSVPVKDWHCDQEETIFKKRDE